jgi:hypothetical protein
VTNRQDVPHTRTTTATYMKSWIAIYSDSKASSLCLASKPALGWRPPLRGASRRFIDPSRACTNSALPNGRPVWAHRRISVSLDSISPAARYSCQALAVQFSRHTSKSNCSFRTSSPQCAAALDHFHALRLARQAGAHRVQLRIAQRFPQMHPIQRAGVIATLPGMATRLMNRVPIDRIAPMCMPQRQCQAVSIVRSDDQMHVIRHQAITDQPHPWSSMFWCKRLRYAMRSASQSRINPRALPRWVKWCGTSTARTRAKRVTRRNLAARGKAFVERCTQRFAETSTSLIPVCLDPAKLSLKSG